jgi:hypothetical protein
MMEELEDVGHDPAERTTRLMDVSQQTKFTLIEPNSVARGTGVDFHIFEISFLQITPTFRTFHEILTPLDVPALLVEQGAHLLDQVCILTRKVLLLVARRVVLRVTMHNSSNLSGTALVLVRRTLGCGIRMHRVRLRRMVLWFDRYA